MTDPILNNFQSIENCYNKIKTNRVTKREIDETYLLLQNVNALATRKEKKKDIIRFYETVKIKSMMLLLKEISAKDDMSQEMLGKILNKLESTISK